MARGRRKKFRFKPGFELDPRVITIFVWVMVSFLAVAGLGLIVYRSSLFTVNKVRANIEIPKIIENKILGESIFSVDIKTVHQQISRNNPQFQQVRITKRFPSTIDVSVIERKPFAQLKTSRYAVLDREGFILASFQNEPYPDLVPIEINDYKSFLKPGDSVDDGRLKKALALLETIKSHELDKKYKIESINATILGSLYCVINDTEVRFGKSDFSRKMELLTKLLTDKLKDSLSSVKYVDLRYERVYIGYKR
ncbi:MAG: FtsQ-type POTRA domain-containing protein [Candidatus Omnitrophica bacterium]|nr:FtsQ-type POTRA domain-containing protein [Candidatus Omnitrophota bacterium]